MRHHGGVNNRLLIIATLSLAAFVVVLVAAIGGGAWWVLAAVVLALLVVAVWDMTQKRHAILRNYPLLGHMRYLLESVRPEIQQYFIERNFDGKPFDRDTRSIVYARAKGQDSHKAFGTERDTDQIGYEYLLHSSAPVNPPADPPTVHIGGPDCTQPVDISLMNISSMSFGSLSANAVLAMNKGAGMGGFIHETGEGGLTKYHRGNGAELFWEIGSGYFGCRDEQGRFSEERFAEKAVLPEVRGITVKLSQGAKPGLGGMLPKEKISKEIAEAREIPMDQDCLSPASHSAFRTPREMVRFVGRLRELSGGKPIGIKFCVGSRVDVLAMCKAMWEERTAPDYIIVDGSEGGTGAAPLEYSDHVGTPLTEGLMIVHNALVGSGLRHMIKLGAAGKVATGSDIVKRLVQGADFTMSARAMMMATGCIQAQKCHTNECPVGVATQDPRLQRALDVPDKANRVFNYHRLTVREAVQIMASMGVTDPAQLNTRMLRRRVDHLSTRSYASIYHWLRQDELLNDPPPGWDADWQEADADHFGEHARIDYLHDRDPDWQSELRVPERTAAAPAHTSPLPQVGGAGSTRASARPVATDTSPIPVVDGAVRPARQDGEERASGGTTDPVTDEPRGEGRVL
ncbi:FMN-binding glutamate synthase family protein [Micrococcus sp.]|uniref:FMN-binding glutamate synthase family protein n=1 Tax=Micrococcus sp. TaxID=1271 RepID=UPI002A91D49F|nr:FMN-binding glutamate synthase family protein [Micrococcus sp.]MDY6054862.1 FMN-binding glutamate synthase family protein [Micrococcus sp.]